MSRAISKYDRTAGRRPEVIREYLPDGTADWETGGGYSAAEVAAHLSVSVKTVRRLLKDGRLQHVRIGRRVVITATSVELLLEQAR